MQQQNNTRVPLRILYLEDSPKDAEIVREILAAGARGVTMDLARTEREFESLLGGPAYDLILTDFRVPGFDGFASLRKSAAAAPGVPVICISGAIGEETAVDLLKAGAVDYLLKDRLARLPQAIERAVAETKEKAARRQATEDLRRAKQETENFLYVTSHDLSSPLVNIQGFSQNLARDIKELLRVLELSALPENVRLAVKSLAGGSIPSALGYISESVSKMDQLIGSLLKVYRQGRVEMSPKIVDVDVVLKNVLAVMRYQIEEAGAEVKAGGLPPCKADPGAVSQILSNLLSNAINSRDKSRKLMIDIGAEIRGAAVLYRISDNGIGIKAADLPDIWQIFSGGRAPGLKKGEGIGLAMSKMLAEMNGGRMRVDSKGGEGSTFFLEMPAE